MLQHYLVIFGGSLLGMLLTILVQSEIINRSNKFEAGFNDALKFYTRKNRGALYVGLLVVFIFMFLLPNLISSDHKWLENFLANLRFWSVGIGIGSQAIGFLAVKKTHEKIDNIDKTT